MHLSGTLAAVALLLLMPAPVPAQQDLGEVAFANSGAPAAQAPFRRGLALLHNFEYRPRPRRFARRRRSIPASPWPIGARP